MAAESKPHSCQGYEAAPPDSDGDIWRTAHTPRITDDAFDSLEDNAIRHNGAAVGAGNRRDADRVLVPLHIDERKNV